MHYQHKDLLVLLLALASITTYICSYLYLFLFLIDGLISDNWWYNVPPLKAIKPKYLLVNSSSFSYTYCNNLLQYCYCISSWILF